MKNIVATLLAALMLGFATAPAAAADGYSATFFSESSFLTLAAGQTGQFSVGFVNTGTQTWHSGTGTGQMSLHTNAPFDNTRDSDAGWAVNWPAPNIYAVQAQHMVEPGQTAFFTFSVRVPTGATGLRSFYGRLAVGGVGPLEDVGYYHGISVQAPFVGGGFPGGVSMATGPVHPTNTRYAGIVTDVLSHAPLAGVCVYAGPLTGCPTPNLNTDEAGRWAVDFPTGSAWDINFEHPRYVPYRRPAAPSSFNAGLVNRFAGYSSTVVSGVGPLPAGQIRHTGTVYESVSGLPVPGVCVYAGPPTGCPVPALATDDLGKWVLDLPAGSVWNLNFEHPAYAPARPTATIAVLTTVMTRR